MDQPNQPKKIDAMMQGYMVGAFIRMAGLMMGELMFTIIPRELKRMEESLKHEPTSENWEDFWQYQGERNAIPKCLERAKDREKIRYLVFGEEGDSNSSIS